jgi:hypothetical protein
VLLALGRASWLFRFTALWFVTSLASVALGLRWGVIGVAACYAVATALVEPLRTYITARALRTSAWSFVAALGGIAQAAVLMAMFLLVARSALVAVDVSAGMRLVALVVSGGAVYVTTCLWRAPEVMSEIRVAIGDPRRRAPDVPDAMDAPLERV